MPAQHTSCALEAWRGARSLRGVAGRAATFHNLGITALSNLSTEVASAAVRTLPPASVTVGVLSGGLDPQWFIAIPTVGYILLQGAYLLWKWRREAKAKHPPNDG